MNMPEYLIEAVKPNNRKPNADRMSVTQLGDSPLIRTLKLENWDKIKEEPEDMLWALYGTALDTIVKTHNKTGMVDLKLEHPMDDYIVVGKPDIYYPTSKFLVDVKTTSVWNLKEPRSEWIFQLNTYKYLMEKVTPQLEVDKLEIHGIGRDWRRNEKLRYGNTYPDSAFVILDIPIWPDIEKVIDAHLKDHKNNPKRECSYEEKWRKPDQYAVMKKGRKSALRVLDSKSEAQSWCVEKNLTYSVNGAKSKTGIEIVKRPGSCVRCEGYCSVSEFCPYWEN